MAGIALAAVPFRSLGAHLAPAAEGLPDDLGQARPSSARTRDRLTGMRHPEDRSLDLRAAIEASGYYPAVVAESVFAAVAGEPVEAFLVHHEPTIDERDEVRRHVTVLVLTASRVLIGHTDEHAPDDLLPSPYTSSSTEAVTLDAVRSVVVNRIVANPAAYADGRVGVPAASEVVLTIGWGALSRVDLEPAACDDPNCDADHGYTGMVSADDFSIRVSAAAEGPRAVADLLSFAEALSARTVAGSRAG